MTIAQERHLSPVRDHDARAPMYDIRIERAALGLMMTSIVVAQDAIDELVAGDFYKPEHAPIFQAIVGVVADGGPVNGLVVTERLMARGELNRAGGAAYLEECLEEAQTAGTIGWHVGKLVELAQRRRLYEYGLRVIQMAQDRSLGVPDITGVAETELLTVTSDRQRFDGSDMADLVPKLFELIEAAAEGRGTPAVTTGIRDLDRMFNGGMRAGQVITIAARPGVGKSVLLCDFGRHIAVKRGEAVLFFNLEMGEVELGQRILSAESGVPLHAIMEGTLEDDDWTKLARAGGRLTDARLRIFEEGRMSLSKIRSTARAYRIKHGPIGAVLIDYLQLIDSGDEKYENEVARITAISRGLKLLAKELDCPVVTAAQLNRNPDARTDKRPILSDLRSSGSIEQDSDIVVLLHRDDYHDIEHPRAGEIDLIVAKNRGGARGTVPAAAQLHLSRIVDMAQE